MALHTAIKRCDINQVKDLINNRANINEKSEHKRNPLHIAASCGNVEIVDLLLKKYKKLDLNIQDDRGWTPLHFSISKAHFEVSILLLSQKNIKVFIYDEDKNSPFHYLCRLSLDTSGGSFSVSYYYRTLSLYYSKGIDINERNKYGDTPLHMAIRTGNIEAVDFLCRNGAEVNITNNSDETPLFLAVQGRRYENVRTLLTYGAVIDMGNHDYGLLNQIAGNQLTKTILSEVNTIRIVMAEKEKELKNIKKNINRDTLLLEELDKTLKKEKKNNYSSLKNARLSSKARYNRILSQDLQICERMNSIFFRGSSGCWSCCVKQIICPNITILNRVSSDIQFHTDLKHPNILQVFKVQSDTKSSVHEFVEWPTKSLKEILEYKKTQLGNHKYLPFFDIIKYALDIAKPLLYLHNQNIVSRSIKTDHIFTISKDSKNEPLFIGVYYACKLDSIWSVSGANTDFFEPEYSLASEARLNKLTYSFSSDIWAFGMVLYEILTLTTPYNNLPKNSDIGEYMKMQSPILPKDFIQQSSGKFTNPSSKASLYNHYKLIIDIIIKCTNINASKRPTISQIIYSLEHLVEIDNIKKKHKVGSRPKQSYSNDLKAISLNQEVLNDWPESPKDILPYHILPKIPKSDLILSSDSYIIEAPRTIHLESNTNDNPIVIQFSDQSICYYKNIMAFKLHENYIGISDDDKIAILSICPDNKLLEGKIRYKIILRTIEFDYRILISCDNLKDRFKVLKQHPSIQPYKLNLIKDTGIIKELLDYEKSQIQSNTYKFGIIYRKKGQDTDDDMYSNESASIEFNDFLHFIGSHILLKGWDKFRGGLDVISDTTGTQSVYTTLDDNEIMFHVSTMLPFDTENPQQLPRKRHIGNDIVVIIFQDSEADPFEPTKFTSNFNHVFVVIQPVRERKSNTSKSTVELTLDFENEITSIPSTKYLLSIVYKDCVSIHPRPFLTEPCEYLADNHFQKFLLTKLINCERVAMKSPAFASRLTHVRKQLLTSIYENYKKKSKK